jgi:hypothetical protein
VLCASAILDRRPGLAGLGRTGGNARFISLENKCRTRPSDEPLFHRAIRSDIFRQPAKNLEALDLWSEQVALKDG